ncbi:MAG: ABC transporter ATP-binding protein [Armatimonadetes bacterium]|nr:ABC transporter ATP-binding protein [Armatimonadota bacterium]
MPAVIEVEGLTKRYNQHLAVDHISFEVEEGEIFGFLGPNGAGKTTTQRMLTGVLPPTEGCARVLGRDMVTDPLAAKQKIGVVPEVSNPYMEMSGWQNMVFAGELYGLPGRRIRERAEQLLEEFGLWDRRGDATRRYSKGMRQRLALAMSLIHEPRIVFLDEPTGGLDVESQRMIHGKVRGLAATGATIFYTTHNIEEANVLCDRVAIICRGQLVALDTPEALKAAFAGSQSVEVSFSTPVKASRLEGIAGVTRVEKRGDKLSMFTPTPGPVIEAVVAFAREHDTHIVSLNTTAPSLEEVFISLSSGDAHQRHTTEVTNSG